MVEVKTFFAAPTAGDDDDDFDYAKSVQLKRKSISYNIVHHIMYIRGIEIIITICLHSVFCVNSKREI